MFTDKLTLAIAEAAKKCMDEDLVGNQHKIDANKNGKIDADDFKKLRKEELKGNQHKIDANKNGKIDADDFKKLRKEEAVNEEGQYGYVAFSHDGKRHELHANTSYEAKQKAVKHFNPPKSKQHLVTVHLAQKDGKDVVHTATESVQEGAVPSTEKTVKLKHKTSGKEIVVTARSANEYKTKGFHPVSESAIDDLRDRQAAAREANPFKAPAKKQDPAKRTVQGSQYGGSKQKQEPEKEIEESMYNPGLEALASKKRAERTGKPSNPALEKLAHEKAKAKYLNKEEVEESVQLDELSRGTLGSYVKKASEQGKKAAVSAGQSNQALGKALASGNKHLTSVHDDNIIQSNKLERKRTAGVAKAVDKLTREEVEVLDESKAHIEQHLADRDINAKVTGKTVKVHSSDVASATKHVKMAGYKDHKVVGGLNEEKMSDEDMTQREKIVKGMKKNLKGFKARYGADAEKVMYATATKQAMKEEKKDKYDEGEYDREGDMAKSDLRSIIANAQKLHDMIEDADNLPEWVQSKITKSEDYISTVANYMTSEMSEEVEQIDELSKNTLGSYVKKAEADRDDSIKRYNSDERDAQGNKIRDKDLSPARKAIDKMMFKRSDKRIAGLKTANAKLAKEEVEELDEVDKKTLGNYITKAHDQLMKHTSTVNFKGGRGDKDAFSYAMDPVSIRKTANRTRGMNQAINRLTKEEVTNDGFKAELEDNKAKAAGTKKQPDVAKAAVQSVKQESFSQKLSVLKEGVRSFLKDKNNG